MSRESRRAKRIVPKQEYRANMKARVLRTMPLGDDRMMATLEKQLAALPGKPEEGTTNKSDPTIIKFEPFLKIVRAGAHRGSNDGHASPGQHLVKGHYQNFKYEAPRFGHKPVLGRTYGRLWVKPHTRGNPAHGIANAPRHVIEIGDLTGNRCAI